MKKGKKLYVPALRGAIGDWVYYSSLLSASQISDWIETVKNIREAKSLEEVLQRELKSRIAGISKYLTTDDTRFFNSIIIGVFDGIPDWFEFELKSGPNLKLETSTETEILDSVGVLVFNGDERMFAIDGQHRVEGIKLALTKAKNEDITSDQFSVIFIAHNDTELGMKRTRKLFSDINKNAKPVSKGDKVIIDEQELTAITARRLYAKYKHFKGGQLIAPTENAKLDKNDTVHFTNLIALDKVCSILKKSFKIDKGTLEWEEVNVIKFYTLSSTFFDFLIKYLPEYNSYFVKNTLTLETARLNNRYLSFRPVGLFLLAKLWEYYYRNDNLNFLQQNISKISLIMPQSQLNGILWNNGKMEVKTFNQTFAFDFALYLLGETLEYEGLVKRYREILKDDSLNLPKPIISKIVKRSEKKNN